MAILPVSNISDRRRRGLARSYTRVLDDARSARRGMTARVPVQRDQVIDAAPQIERLVIHLQDRRKPVDAAAVEQLHALVTDGGGPLYARVEPGTLRRRISVINGELAA